MTRYNRLFKRIVDILLSLMGLIFLLPLGVVVAVAIKLSSPGSIIYVQKRIGRKGKAFNCMKFRTMYIGTERHGSVTASSDTRITGVGRVLRRGKIDELPQLWNVFMGTMSLVGPRPDVPGYADKLIGDDRIILSVRPGITGPASIYFRDEEKILAAQKEPVVYNDTVLWPGKIKINKAYATTCSFTKDIGYLVITVFSPIDKLLGLMRNVEMELKEDE